MQCPVCNHLNSAMDVRCIQCSTTLIHEAVGHSAGYRKTTEAMDARVYSGVGAIFGFFLVAIFLKFIVPGVSLDDRAIYAISVGGAWIGGILGRQFLRAKTK